MADFFSNTIVEIVIAIIGSGSLVSYFVKKWIEKKFAKELQNNKLEHDKEMESLKFRINSTFDRISKIHEKEFEVLPIAWGLLYDAHSALFQIVKPVQKMYTFDNLSKLKLSEFLEKSFLQKYQKQEFIESSSKNDYYAGCLFDHYLFRAEKTINEIHVYNLKNGIFLSPEMKTIIIEVVEMMWSAYHALDVRTPKGRADASEIVNKQINPVKDEIEAMVQKRLHFNKVE